MQNNSNDIFHGMTLQKILEFLVERYGFEELGQMININCFVFDPSIASSLKFLRRTPWARARVEELYAYTVAADKRDQEQGRMPGAERVYGVSFASRQTPLRQVVRLRTFHVIMTL